MKMNVIQKLMNMKHIKILLQIITYKYKLKNQLKKIKKN